MVLTCPGGGRPFWYSAWPWWLELYTSMFWPDPEVFDARFACEWCAVADRVVRQLKERGDTWHLTEEAPPRSGADYFSARGPHSFSRRLDGSWTAWDGTPQCN